MMKIFKKLFCRHDYKLLWHRNFINGLTAKTLYIFKCSKCGRKTKRYGDI